MDTYHACPHEQPRHVDRRQFLRTLGLGGAGIALAATGMNRIAAPASASPSTPLTAPTNGAFTLPPLPYTFAALEPHIDALTMQIHHGRHHAAYVTNLNAALKDYPDLARRD